MTKLWPLEVWKKFGYTYFSASCIRDQRLGARSLSKNWRKPRFCVCWKRILDNTLGCFGSPVGPSLRRLPWFRQCMWNFNRLSRTWDHGKISLFSFPPFLCSVVNHDVGFVDDFLLDDFLDDVLQSHQPDRLIVGVSITSVVHILRKGTNILETKSMRSHLSAPSSSDSLLSVFYTWRS